MERLIASIDKKHIARFIVSNTSGGPLSEDFNRSSFLGAKAAGVAQRMRQALVGDAETTDRLIQEETLMDPVGRLAADIESAHLMLALSRSRIGAMAYIGEKDDAEEALGTYFQSLSSLFDLYNDGIDLLDGSTAVPRDNLLQLLAPLRDELLHANRIYRKRILGIF